MEKIAYAGRRWKLWRDTEVRPAAEQVEEDSRLLDRVLSGGGPVIRIWQNVNSLVVSRADTRLPDFRHAAETLASEGWPLVIRGSGGTAVLHGAGIVNISLCYQLESARDFSIGKSYGLLCELCCELLGCHGVEAAVGALPGSFCDGAYNIVTGGKKIGGTAQRVVPRGASLGVLSHVSLLVNPDLSQFCQVLRRFYGLAGAPCAVSPRNTTSVIAALEEQSRGSPAGNREQVSACYDWLLPVINPSRKASTEPARASRL